MARDTDADYAVTAANIVNSAYEELNIITDGGSPSAGQSAYGLKKLNLLVKNLMGPSNRLYRGMKVWQRASSTLTLTAKNNFDIYSGSTDLNLITPVNIISCMLRNSDDEDAAMYEMTRAEYDALSDKSVSGDPTKWLYEREWEYGTLYLDTVPSDTTKTIVFTYHRALFDMDAGTEDVDFPQQWHLPLVYLLAANMAPRYGIDPTPYAPLLEEARENANTFYPEKVSMYFQPGKEW